MGESYIDVTTFDHPLWVYDRTTAGRSPGFKAAGPTSGRCRVGFGILDGRTVLKAGSQSMGRGVCLYRLHVAVSF